MTKKTSYLLHSNIYLLVMLEILYISFLNRRFQKNKKRTCLLFQTYWSCFLFQFKSNSALDCNNHTEQFDKKQSGKSKNACDNLLLKTLIERTNERTDSRLSFLSRQRKQSKIYKRHQTLRRHEKVKMRENFSLALTILGNLDKRAAYYMQISIIRKIILNHEWAFTEKMLKLILEETRSEKKSSF